MIQEGFIVLLEMKDVLFWIPHGSIELYPSSNTIFYQGHFPLGLYILTKGAIAIEYTSSRKLQHVILRDPAMISLNHVLESTPNKYTIKTLEASEVIFIPQTVLRKPSFVKEASKFR